MGFGESGRRGISRQQAACRTALFLFCFVATLAAFASPARAFVYWAEYGAGHGAEIWRASLDGKLNRPFISGAKTTCGVAVDGQHIYWGNILGNSIGRANLDGTGVDQNFISTPGAGTCDVAVNGSQIWWVGYSAEPDPNSTWIGRANLDGTGVVQRMFNYPQVNLPCGLALNSTYVYWVNNFGTTPNIWRAGLDGTPAPTEIVSDAAPTGGTREACWPSLTDSRLYWWSYPGVGIVSTDLDGNDRRLVVASDAPGGIAIFAGKIYWASISASMFALSSSASISRADLDGSQAEFGFTGAMQPEGLAVDAGIPSNRFSFGKLTRFKRTGTANLRVRVPETGRLVMVGKGVARQRPSRSSSPRVGRVIPGKGTLIVHIKAKNRKRRKLVHRGKVVLHPRFTFSPTGGSPLTKRRPVTLFQR